MSYETIKTDELEWNMEEDDSINELNTQHFIERLKRINNLPLKHIEIHFSDDTWDLAPLSSTNIANSRKVFHFRDVSDVFKDELKSYVLVKLIENKNKLQTIRAKKNHISRFFRYLYDNNVFSIKDVTTSHIENYLLGRTSLSQTSQKDTRLYIKDFYEYYSINYDDIFSNDIKTVLETGDYKAYKAYKNANKYPNIPQEFFNKMMKRLVSSIKSQKEPPTLRATACILILASQIGLRTGELMSIKVNGLKPKKLLNGDIAHYLKYETWKREKGDNKKSIERTYINDLSKLAFDTLKEIHKENRMAKGVEFLYCPKWAKALPFSPESFSKKAVDYFIYHGNELGVIDAEDKFPELQTANLKGRSYESHHLGAKSVSYPNNSQFRVHVCTELYNKGIPLEYIKKFMGHLSSQMEGYYVRPAENQVKEDIKFSKKVIEDIVTGNAKILGSNTKALTTKIQEFIEEENYNIATDIHEIAETLSKSIPIRAKTGGVCIKSSTLRDCRKDVMTNELFCSYGVCPNIFHFYYMSNVSYRQCKELVETIDLNKKRGHLKQAQKESNMLVQLTRSKLIPELDELGKEIVKKGADTIISEYPDLSKIVKHYDEIVQEANEWRNLNKIS